MPNNIYCFFLSSSPFCGCLIWAASLALYQSVSWTVCPHPAFRTCLGTCNDGVQPVARCTSPQRTLESGVPGDALKAQKHVTEMGRSDFCLSYERVQLSSHDFFFKISLFYVHDCFVCLYVCVPRACLVSGEIRRSYSWVWVILWVLGIETRFSTKTFHALNTESSLQVSTSFFFKKSGCHYVSCMVSSSQPDS